MTKKIKFIRNVTIVVQDTADSMPYTDEYKAGDTELVEILGEQSGTIHVQFGDSAVGWIKKRHIEIACITD